ncbi:DUF262 domain-containing protein [uncultured Eubacterium sp.]|uniref:DUF262 domain-containing protein n=1 Tax=uncultured Eubacterium sp. TaxID=165185 RepID=UPI00258D4AAE|nr:DUF262 domain-containing protein [uncultured Eubacterium sp.]
MENQIPKNDKIQNMVNLLKNIDMSEIQHVGSPSIDIAVDKVIESCNQLKEEINGFDNTLKLVPVSMLLGEKFYIPDYQRGYRWTSNEVNKLLEDLTAFFSDGYEKNPYYCMQPLVVFYNKKHWEVIDGQQRLTTMFLILNYLGEKPPFEISYGSRDGSADYLKDPTFDKSVSNVDFYHIYKASQTIKSYFENYGDKETFYQNLINSDASNQMVDFIWYDVSEKGISPEEKFSDLNVGKINLTNAELIKALLLNNVSDEHQKIRLATEWDEIEHAFHNDDFWSFIYGENDSKYETRIELIFDILMKKGAKEANKYFTFDKYQELIANINDDETSISNHVMDELWKAVTNLFHHFKSWHEDRYLYHIIGYLRYLKHPIDEIFKVFNDSNSKQDFRNKLKELAIIKTIYEYEKKDKKYHKLDIPSLSYEESKDKKHIRDILMLFNILSILECNESSVNFSFSNFYKHKWDLEHVRSQTAKDIQNGSKKDLIDWIICNLEYFTGVEYNKEWTIEDFKSKIIDSETYSKLIGYCKTACESLLGLLSESSDEKIAETYKAVCTALDIKDDMDFKQTHFIGNLVLLDQTTNRGYGNAFFPIKRRFINENEKKGIYILPCTKNVFSKNYSIALSDLMNWTETDAQAYTQEIINVLES